MRRVNFHLTEEQYLNLKNVDSLPVSEHIRRAVDLYIQSRKASDSAKSPSSKGGSNG